MQCPMKNLEPLQCPMKNHEPHVETMGLTTEDQVGGQPRGVRAWAMGRTRCEGLEEPRKVRPRVGEMSTVDKGDGSNRNSDREDEEEDDDKDENKDDGDDGTMTGTTTVTTVRETGNTTIGDRTSLRRPHAGPTTTIPPRNTPTATAGADAAGTESRRPRTGPAREDAPGDYHEKEPKRDTTKMEKTRRRHLRKRTRESGTQGGTKGEDDGSGQEEDLD